jgi:4-amino-4-deoxy-L-arabinose transferase-like glycosyltransferase
MNPALVGILLLGLVLRLLFITAPLLDAHRWRQIDTATMARYFYQDSLNPLYPQVNWGGPEGYVESEFPLVPWIAALLYYAFGPDDVWGRVTSVAFSIGLILSLYYLVAEIRGRPAGRAAALLVAVSPGAVYYGRTFMPDTAMLFFSVAAVLGVVRYLQTDNRRALMWGSAALALAILVKLPAILILAPIAAAAAQARGRTMLADRRLGLAVGVALLAAAAWYIHAYFIFRETGLTFGIIAHPARTYPPVISPGPWPDVFSKWSSVSLLTDIEFYRQLLHRLVRLHLTPIGLAVALVGLLTWRGKWSMVPGGWLIAVVAFILVAGEGNIAHDYYQLPLVVIGAMYFGAVAAPLFDRDWIRVRIGAGWWAPVAVGGIVLAMALLMFFESGVIRTHFRAGRLDTDMLRAGQAVDRAVGNPKALLVVVDDYGVTSPVLLYLANRRGWSFGPRDLTPSTLEWLRRFGADYFVTTDWSDLQKDNGDLSNYLSRYRPIPLPGGPAGTLLFDLRQTSE